MKITNPITLLAKLITGVGSETIADGAQKIDERDILRGLTVDVVDTIAARYKLVGELTGSRVEFTLEKRVP